MSKEKYTRAQLEKAYTEGYNDGILGKPNRLTAVFNMQPVMFQPGEIESLPEKVLGYLNKRKPSKRDFGATRSNLTEIKARIKEKYTFEDFKAVIDYIVNEWANSKKMKSYIRPSTIFGSKFDEYLVKAKEKLDNNYGSDNFVEHELSVEQLMNK